GELAVGQSIAADQRDLGHSGHHLTAQRSRGIDAGAGKVDDVRPQFGGALDPRPEVSRLVWIEGAEIRWVDDGPAVSQDPVRKPGRNPPSEGGLVVDNKAPPLPQAFEGKVGSGRPFVELRGNHPKEVIRASGSKPRAHPLAVPVGG